jgi:trimeric autotransporter adhesin
MNSRSTTRRLCALVPALVLVASAAPLAAQDPGLIRAGVGNPLSERFRADTTGAFIAFGFARDAGATSLCAPFIPATGAGTRFFWHPCRGAVRWGRVMSGGTYWDDANIGDYSLAAGNQVRASGYGSFAFGDNIDASGTVAVGFGASNTVSGTAGFAAGASNTCSGFACVAIGYVNHATGQGSVALGYRVTARSDYAIALGYRASSNGFTGTMVMGDESTTDSIRNQFNNEFRARYTGGFRLRVSTAANAAPGVSANVGCDLTISTGSWSCASSRTIKDGFEEVDGEDVLRRLRDLPVTTWTMLGDSAGVRHMGPVAEDFHAAFGLGPGETTIGLGDIDGVNLAAVKALEARTAQQETLIRQQAQRIREQDTELAELRQRLARIEAILGTGNR